MSNMNKIGKETLLPAGIRQIAKALNISIGTVDRVLHERPGISAKTRDRVLTMAQKLNCTPNVAARNLRLNRYLRVGVFLPEQISSFFNPMRDGIQDAAEHWSGSTIKTDFYTYPRLGEGELKAMTGADWQSYDGVIVAPGDPSAMSYTTASRRRGDSNRLRSHYRAAHGSPLLHHDRCLCQRKHRGGVARNSHS